MARQPNHRFAAALAESGWTGQQLALAVNAVAAEAGLVLSYGRASVGHWQRGTMPRPPVHAQISEALSRRLNRTVTAADLGFAPTGSDEAPPTAQANGPVAINVVGELGRLASRDAEHRRILAHETYALAVLAVPGWADFVPDPIPAGRGPQLQLSHIEAVEAMTHIFRVGDDAFGGGHGRHALGGYLAADVVPALRACGRGALRRRMFRAASHLAYLCAYMCFDDGLQGGAQRYYQIALELAGNARDPATYAVTLRAMSQQACALGHHDHAVALAETAAATGSLRPRQRAFVHGQLAVAHAAAGNVRPAMTSMAMAERDLDREAAPTSDICRYHHAALSYQQAQLRTLTGDRAGAIAALKRSLRSRPREERRSRAVTTARLAELQLDQGHLEQAVETWHDFLDDYPYLASHRVTRALMTMRARLRPHKANGVAAGLLGRVDLMVHTRHRS
jgi:hypothetical protein